MIDSRWLGPKLPKPHGSGNCVVECFREWGVGEFVASSGACKYLLEPNVWNA